MNQSQKIWLSFVAIFIIALFYILKSVLTPFFIAALLAYLGDPLVIQLQKLRLPRTFAVTIVFLVIMALVLMLLFLLIPMLSRQIIVFAGKLPQTIVWAQEILVPWINQHFNTDFSIDKNDLPDLKQTITEHWQQAGDVMHRVWQTLSASSIAFVGWLINLLLIPVVTFYLLRDWDRVINGTSKLLPRQIEPKITLITRECNEVLGAFLRGQLLVMLGLAIIYSVGLSIVGLDLALLIGCVAGILAFIPYLGIAIGIIMSATAAVVQFHDWLHFVYVVIVFVIGHLIESMLLTPWLVGERIGLHPVAVIFAVLAGGHLFGFVGILVALPVAAIIMVLLRHIKQHYVQSQLYDAR